MLKSRPQAGNRIPHRVAAKRARLNHFAQKFLGYTAGRFVQADITKFRQPARIEQGSIAGGRRRFELRLGVALIPLLRIVAERGRERLSVDTELPKG